MEIIHFAAELAPIGKVGGLGDVLQGLSKALLAKGHKVEVFIPKYDVLNLNEVKGLKKHETFSSFSVTKGIVDSIPVTFIESPLFERGCIYGCPDDTVRFTFFCFAALEYLKKTHRHPDVIHLHDWHTALAAPLLKAHYPELKAFSIFTIHNLAYQGHCEESVLDRVGWKSTALKEGHHYNLMKGGILYADWVTTVSPSYANEILTTELGGNLRSVLKAHKEKFSGVLNGLDYSYWNPENDPYLPSPFNFSNLNKREKVKKELQRRFSLKDSSVPLVGVITRLVPQKGPELIKAALLRTLEWGGQFILLGSASDEATLRHFHNLKRAFTDSGHVHMELTYNEELSHLVYGGSDLFVVPSLFEPCGLTQLIAMRYGSIPLVRETGGLADTVFDGVNGFTFGPPTVEALWKTMDRALPLWNTPTWEAMVESGMQADYSWDIPAENYLELYRTHTAV